MTRWCGLVLLCVLSLSVIQVRAQAGIPAQVIHTTQNIHAHVLPDEAAPLMLMLNSGMHITALGRSHDATWIQADFTNNIIGWVNQAYVVAHYEYDFAALPVAQPDEDMVLQYMPFWNFDTPHNLEIFQRGLARGNGMNVFSTVGDSITVSAAYLTPYGSGVYDLGEFDYLQHVLDFFGTDRNSSFAQTSSAVRTGWTTHDVLNLTQASKIGCPQGYIPLTCEYGFKKPAFALIMLGTNDATTMGVDEFEANLNEIVEITLGLDIVPVLSTVPPLLLPEWDERPYNHAIIRTAQTQDLSLINYWLALQSLPNYGISSDWVHPSAPASNAGTTLFTAEYIRYGYTMRNLVTLQGLDLLLQNGVYPAFGG